LRLKAEERDIRSCLSLAKRVVQLVGDPSLTEDL